MQKIIIIGGGFGGVFLARTLAKKNKGQLHIELISDRNYFVFQPLLPEVASGTINAEDAVSPLRLLLPDVHVRLAEVKGIDPVAKTVQLVQGRKRILHHFDYDHLIIASGQITDLSLFRGFEQHSLTMKDLADAFHLRNQVIQCLELADVTENTVLKKRLLTFVVAGGGFSGVETIGELSEMIRRTLHFYPNIQMDDIRLILIQRGKRILPELTEKLSEYAKQKLEKRGIEVRLGCGVKSASSTALVTSDGDVINTTTIITTIGNGPSAFVKSLGLPLERGKIKTNTQMQVEDVEDVWALGDIAAIPMADGNIAPPTAQFTVREAATLADNILASIDNKPLKPFAYQPRGSLASLGNYSAVANVFGVNFYGLLAWFMWRSVYISMLPGLSTRIRVALNWAFDYIMPRNIVHMEQTGKPACHYMHFAEGEIVYTKGEWVDGFYVVVEGELLLEVDSDDHKEAFRRRFKPGDHWGERIIQNDCMTTGCLKASQDTIVMVVKKEDFKRMRGSLPQWDAYFQSLDPGKYSQVLLNMEKTAAPANVEKRHEPEGTATPRPTSATPSKPTETTKPKNQDGTHLH